MIKNLLLLIIVTLIVFGVIKILKKLLEKKIMMDALLYIKTFILVQSKIITMPTLKK